MLEMTTQARQEGEVIVSPGILTTEDALAEARKPQSSHGYLLRHPRYSFHGYCGGCGALLWDVPIADRVPKFPQEVGCWRCGVVYSPKASLLRRSYLRRVRPWLRRRLIRLFGRL